MPANIPKNIVMTSTTALRSVMCMAMLIVSLVVNVGSLAADTAQYYYDELGRLVGVVNAQGDAAVYNYDAVGNLLSIQRFTTGATGVGIFLMTPGSSIVNKNIELRGFGFTTPPSSNQVQFNGTTATVMSATATSIIVTVPTGATTGPVTVTNANGVATSPQPFTVLVPPIITGIAPLKAPQGTVTRVLIGGFNLGSASSVQFTQAGLSASIVTGGSETLLPVNVTVGASVPVGAYTFSVTTPGGTAQSGAITIGVGASIPSFETAMPASVFNPFPAQMPPPPGASMTVAPPVSVGAP